MGIIGRKKEEWHKKKYYKIWKVENLWQKHKCRKRWKLGMLSDSLLETTFLFPFSQVSSTTYSIKTTVLIKHVHKDRAVSYSLNVRVRVRNLEIGNGNMEQGKWNKVSGKWK